MSHTESCWRRAARSWREDSQRQASRAEQAERDLAEARAAIAALLDAKLYRDYAAAVARAKACVGR